MSETVYPPNSHKYRERQKETEAVTQEKRVQKVVKTPAKVRTNEIRKVADIFISEDVANVKNYIFMDVLVPAIKKAIYDIVTNGIDMFLYGGNGRGKSNSPSSTKVSYRNFYDQKNNTVNHRSEDTSSHGSFNYDDIVFRNRGEAEAAKIQLQDAIGRYGFVTIADLYDVADLQAPSHTSQSYGWMNVDKAEIGRVRDGYVLKMPRAVPIDY